MKKINLLLLSIAGAVLMLSSCDEDDGVKIHDISSAEKVSVDRFSSDAGTLMVRSASNGLPAANAPVNFDQSGSPVKSSPSHHTVPASSASRSVSDIEGSRRR